MSRILISVPPLAGHVNPTIGLGVELATRGHEVAWTGLPGVVDDLLPPDVTFLPLVGALDSQRFDDMRASGSGLRGPAALKFLWEGFIVPYAEGTAEALLEVVDQFQPDVMIVDQQAVAGAVVARTRGIPWVTSATTSAELTDPLAAMPKVDRWVRDQLDQLQADLGVTPEVAGRGDLRFSELLVIAFTTEALCGSSQIAEAPIRYVGPSISRRPDPTPFPWEWLDAERRLVLVSLGTVNADAGTRFFAEAVDALAGLPVQTVVVASPEIVVGEDSPDLLVRPRVPQLALLEHADAVVSHGGHNTVCETLARGIPLVVAPIRDDQSIIADQVVRSGAGIRVRFGRVNAAELGQAVGAVLDEPSYRDAASTVRVSFEKAGGAAAAADAVLDVLRTGAIK